MWDAEAISDMAVAANPLSAKSCSAASRIAVRVLSALDCVWGSEFAVVLAMIFASLG